MEISYSKRTGVIIAPSDYPDAVEVIRTHRHPEYTTDDPRRTYCAWLGVSLDRAGLCSYEDYEDHYPSHSQLDVILGPYLSEPYHVLYELLSQSNPRVYPIVSIKAIGSSSLAIIIDGGVVL